MQIDSVGTSSIKSDPLRREGLGNSSHEIREVPFGSNGELPRPHDLIPPQAYNSETEVIQDQALPLKPILN
jgi:hypothetical protein